MTELIGLLLQLVSGVVMLDILRNEILVHLQIIEEEDEVLEGDELKQIIVPVMESH